MTTSTPFRDLLHATKLQHGTDGFTLPPKKGALSIFRPLKIQRLRPGLNPRTWVLMTSMLPQDHRSHWYTECPGKNVPDFGRVFLKLKYTDLTKTTYIRSWTVTEIMAREKCGLLAVPPTVPCSHDVLPIHCACPSFSLQPAQEHSHCDCTCKVLGTLKTTATLVRVFM